MRGGPSLAVAIAMVVLGLVLSLAIGLSLGLLGGGGSILTVPVLHYALGFAAHDAVAASLFIVGVTSGFALIPHARAGRVRWRQGLVFGAASMITAFAGGRLGALLPGRALILAFAIVMIAAGTATLVRAQRPPIARTAAPRLGRVAIAGLAVGLVTGVLGAGGGFIIMPALMMLGGLAVHEAIATSLLVIALNAFAGLAGTIGRAPFDLAIVLVVAGLAIAGSLAGARIGHRLPAQRLQRTFGWFVLAVAAAILLRELA